MGDSWTFGISANNNRIYLLNDDSWELVSYNQKSSRFIASDYQKQAFEIDDNGKVYS